MNGSFMLFIRLDDALFGIIWNALATLITVPSALLRALKIQSREILSLTSDDFLLSIPIGKVIAHFHPVIRLSRHRAS